MGDFRMPSLGADMETGTIVEWRVAPGDVVMRGDIVAVVDTEKSDIEIETFEAGTVGQILVPVGTEVPVGTVIATIVTAGQSPVSAATPVVAPIAPARTSTSSPAPAPATRRKPAAKSPIPSARVAGRPRVSPRARRRADELGVDLAAVAEQIRDRPVRADDVDRLAASPSVAPDVPVATTSATPTPFAGGTMTAVGRLMERSKREIPHFYVSEEIDVTRSLDWLEARNAAAPIAARAVPAALLLRAVVVALREVPQLNAHFVDGAVRQAEAVHLGVAVAQRQGGLVAPVIRDAHLLDLDETMAAMRMLVGRARSDALRSSDVSTATITVTNLGDQGAGSVLAVIVPPQVAIVGFGRITERPWAENGMLTVRRVVTATLAADHRASHGHQGARLLRAIARSLAEPEALL